MKITLNGKHALVTGGTRGIGRAITLALAGAGADVMTCYRSDDEAAGSLARELKAGGGDHHVVRADVSTPADVDGLAEECRARFGTIEVLVNNAGVISHVPFAELPLAEWQRILASSLTGAFIVTQKVLPLLPDGASIVTIGSRVATVGATSRAHYTAAKAGLIGLTRSLCKELGGRGIRVNLVAPGMIQTQQDDEIPAQQLQAYRQRYQHIMALGRFGQPGEIAGAVLFLASDLSAYITGETLHVDGGV